MRSIRACAAPIDVRQLGTLGYAEAWQLQRELVDARVAGGPDTLLLLEHPSVYTAGRRTEPHERPVDGTPVIDTDRGGKITWHGPGQLVGYPIVGLADPIDVVDYVRRLEESLISVSTALGLSVGRVAGRSGVCDCDLSAFDPIVPCGIADAGVTSLSAELGRRVSVDDVRARVAEAVCDVLDGRLALASIP